MEMAAGGGLGRTTTGRELSVVHWFSMAAAPEQGTRSPSQRSNHRLTVKISCRRFPAEVRAVAQGQDTVVTL